MGEMCRLCLSEKDVLIPIFYRGSDLPDHIKACLAVQVAAEEPHKHICITCDGKLRYWWTFKLEVQSAQKFLNNQYSKSLYSRAVTSTEENQSSNSDVNKSISPRFDSSPIRVKNCHSLALDSGRVFDNSMTLGGSGPSAVIIKQEKPWESDGRGPLQIMPVSAAMDSNTSYQSSHLDVSSSSGLNNTPARRNSLRSMTQNDDADDDDDCMIIEAPPKRKCPLVTLDDATQKKRQKLSLEDANKSQNNKRRSAGQEEGVSDSLLSVKNGVFCCQTCSETFGSNSSLLRHNIKVHLRKIKCSRCNQAFSCQAYLDAHTSKPGTMCYVPSSERKKPGPKVGWKLAKDSQTQQQTGNVSESEPKKCQYCPSVFTDKEELAAHLKYHSLLGNVGRQNIACPYCSNSMQVYSLPGHVKNVHKMDPDAAGIPNYIDSKMGSKAKSQSTVKAVNGMKIVVFSCNLCKNSYKTLFALKMHKKRFHANVATSGVLKQSKPKKWSCVCTKCKRFLISRTTLAAHEQYCGTDRASVCPFCAQQFESELRLKRHTSEKHSGSSGVVDNLGSESLPTTDSTAVNSTSSPAQISPSPEWKKRKNGPKCLQCGRRFIAKERLAAHSKYCGTDKSFKCFFCPEQYNSSRSVNNHSKRMHNQTVFPCDFCNQKFSTKQEVDDHRKTHKQLLKTKLLHKCRGCLNVYHGVANFSEHKLNCKNVYTFKCEKCFLRFKDQYSLDVHISQCTGKAQLGEKLKLAQKVVKCLQCTNRFSGENDFINHYVESHVNAANSIFSGVNSFDCHFCFFAANNPKSVVNHVPHCRGISFYVVKSSVDKPRSSVAKKSTNMEQTKSPKAVASSSSSKQNDTNIEITKICSPSFMNEHLSASKNAQVVVEKLSDTLIHNVSNLKKENAVYIKTETRKPNPVPANKIQCEYCKRYFTPAGLPSHKCPKKKKMMARIRSKDMKSRLKEQAKPKATTSSHSIKCELCYDMVQQEALPEHLKVIHQAVKPNEMARSMIELSLMKQALSVKEEVPDRNDTEDAASDEGEFEEGDSQNKPQDIENEAEEVGRNEEISEETEMNEDIEEEAEMHEDIEEEAEMHEDIEEEVETHEDTMNEEVDTEGVSNPVDESQEEPATVNCDICQVEFTLSDLEIHLKNVHHAVNPAAMARTMMENSVTFPKITVNSASNAEDDLQEETVRTRCDICKSFFTLPDLEVHLKNVHHAVNPAAMAQTMMENNLSFSTITVNVKSEIGASDDDDDNDDNDDVVEKDSNPSDSQDSEDKAANEGGEERESEEEEESQDSQVDESNVVEGPTDPLNQSSIENDTSTNLEAEES